MGRLALHLQTGQARVAFDMTARVLFEIHIVKTPKWGYLSSEANGIFGKKLSHTVNVRFTRAILIPETVGTVGVGAVAGPRHRGAHYPADVICWLP